MPDKRLKDEMKPPGRKAILVAIGTGPSGAEVVRWGKSLADRLGASWHAVHVETPASNRRGHDPADLTEALTLALQLGANVVKIPAATIADGIALHLENAAANEVVIGRTRPFLPLPWRRALLDQLLRRRPDLVAHIVPTSPRRRPFRLGPKLEPAPFISYGYAAATVAVTLLIALALNRMAGVRSISILFLFPVIAAAARLGVKPALAAALLSTATFNFFFLEPAHMLKPGAIQSWVMAAMLGTVAVYTGMLTSTLRGRIRLSDRSAQENANIASFALKLTRVSDWTATAETVCEQVHMLLDVQTMVLREISGSLEIAASLPSGADLAPVDQAAADWAWSHGEPAGSGTNILAAADWQFQPLKTSLGTLAVLGLAREDGRNPIAADQTVLLSTLVAQASLAHERLLLEDKMRDGRRSSVG